tara:strand:- start:3642 stop:4838 length:1197 start_codon:yes stop_codon:yes gene_type:complete
MPSPTAYLERIRLLQFQKYATATDVTGDPAAPYFLDARNGFMMDTDQARVPRDLIQNKNENWASINGVKSGGVNFGLEMRGLANGGAASGETAAYDTETQLGTILDVITGANGANSTGGAADPAPGTGTTVATTAGVWTVGTAMLLEGVTSGVLQAREVTVENSPDFTFDRTLLQADSTPENVDPSSVIYASSSWYLDAANANHLHGWFQAEGDTFTRKFRGCMSNMSFELESGGICMANTEWQATNWVASGTGGSLTYAAAPAGDPIIAKDLLFCIGNTRYDLISVSVDLGLEFTPKAALDATNAISGFKCIRMNPTITCKLYYDNSTFLNNLQAEGTLDLNLQCGVTAGRTMMFRMPNADPRDVKHSTTDGIETMDVVFHGTNPTAGNGGLRIHIF